MVEIELIADGAYNVPRTEFNIIRTQWTGPKGGTRWVWEVLDTEASVGPTIRSDIAPSSTLREARANLGAFLNGNG